MISPPQPKPTPSFRRRPFAARRRRAHPLFILLRPVLRALVLLGPLAALGLWLLSAPAFGLRSIDVEGNRRVEESWVRRELAGEIGHNLLRLRLGILQRRLSGHPWVRTVELHKELPDRLVVEIREHEPAALLERDDDYVFLSAEGSLITRCPEDADISSYLILALVGTVGPEREGRLESELRRALEIRRALQASESAWSDGLSRIEILGPEDFRLRVENLPFVVLVRGVELSYKSRALDRLLPQILERFEPLVAVDLRFSGRIVLKPAEPSEVAAG